MLPSGGSLFLSPDILAFRARAASPKAGESRFAQGNYSGHLSNLGEPLVLRDASGNEVASTTTPADPTDAQRFLVISEIMYHPADPNPDAEFIELLNTSDTVTLDLGGVAFTEGIDYTFPAGTTLAPGGRTVVHFADFLNGSRLANGGETLKLEDADGSTIREFAYNDTAPWPTTPDGGGPSLVLIAPGIIPEHGDPANWRPSTTFGGNPGGADHVPYSGGDLLDYALPGTPVVRRRIGGFELEYGINIGADAVSVAVETSTDLSGWMVARDPTSGGGAA